MRKITTSLAVVGALLLQGEVAAQDKSQQSQSSNNNQRATTFSGSGSSLGSHQSSQLSSIPILRAGQVQGTQLLGSLQPDESLSPSEDFCDQHQFHSIESHDYHDQDHQKLQCDCKPDRWGCEAKSSHKPNQRSYTETKQAVQATIIPVQAVVANTNQTTSGNECSESVGARQRQDVTQYQVEGRFRKAAYDVQQQCDTEGECFCEEETKNDAWWDYDQDHEVDCDCHDISGQDFLGFSDEGCSCLVKAHIERPDEDIERRIIDQVESTIGDLLSEIVGKALQSSFKTIIQWDGEQDDHQYENQWEGQWNGQ